MTEEERKKNREDSDDDDEVEKVLPEGTNSVGRGKRRNNCSTNDDIYLLHLFISF